MIKAYIRSEYRYLLFFLVLIMLTPLFTGGITDIINGFIVSHYPCIMLNNIYILIIYKRIHFFRKLKDIVIPRTGNKRFYIRNAVYSICSLFIYAAVLFLFFGNVYHRNGRNGCGVHRFLRRKPASVCVNGSADLFTTVIR